MPPKAESTLAPDRWMAAWVAWVMATPWRALAGLSFLVVLAVFGALRLGVDADSSRMLSSDLPAQSQALAVNAAFPGIKQSVAILVHANTPDMADLAVREMLPLLEQQTGEISSVFSVSANPFLQTHGFMFRDLDDVATIFTRVSRSSNLVATLRSDPTPDGFANALISAGALAEKAEISTEALDRLYGETKTVVEAALANQPRIFGWSAVLDDTSTTGSVTRVVTVRPQLDLTRLSPAKPALQAVQRAIADMPAESRVGVDIEVTGEPALRAEEMRSVLSTIGISMALSLVLVVIILRIGLGSTGRAAISFASLTVSLVLTTGFAGFALGELNLVSVAFIVLMVGLGIDFAIHILTHAVELRRTGATHRDAMKMTGHRTGLALILSAVTTSLAFLAFATTDFRGMAQLGLIGGVGVLIAFACAATVIPAVAAIWPGLTDAKALEASPPKHGRHRPMLALLVLAIGVLSIFPASQARFDADPIGLRDPDGPAVQAFRKLAADAETTPYRVSILAQSQAEAAEIGNSFRNAPGIGAVVSLADLVPPDQDEKLTLLDIAAGSLEHAVSGTPTDLSGTAPTGGLAGLAEALSDKSGIAGELHKVLTRYLQVQSPGRTEDLTDRLFRSFPLMLGRLEAMLNADYVDAENLPNALKERYVSPEGRYRVEIIPETAVQSPSELAAFAKTVSDIDTRAAGGPVQLTAAGQTIGNAMIYATLLAALATGALAALATRRIVDTAAILLPLVVAGLMTAAASVLLGLPFNYANVIVLPLLIGIGVDSGIHIALRERRAPGAVFATSTPRAVLFSALTTMAAFGTLGLSDHQGTASMGILLVVSMTAAVGCVLVLTPAILRSAPVRPGQHP
ncbi:MAG: MMPL family transporter [Paracoccaceae bacterium]